MLGFAAMFLLTLAMISTNKQQQDSIKKDVEYVLRIEWQGNSDHDIDMWVQDPTGDMIGFRDKQRNHMFIERDNTGTDVNLKDPAHINEEIVSVLKALPGWYTINLQFFQKRNYPELPNVRWSIIKMKPTIQTFASGTMVMTQQGQEKTIFRMRIDKDGNIEKVDTSVQNLFVLKSLGRSK